MTAMVNMAATLNIAVLFIFPFILSVIQFTVELRPLQLFPRSLFILSVYLHLVIEDLEYHFLQRILIRIELIKFRIGIILGSYVFAFH